MDEEKLEEHDSRDKNITKVTQTYIPRNEKVDFFLWSMSHTTSLAALSKSDPFMFVNFPFNKISLLLKEITPGGYTFLLYHNDTLFLVWMLRSTIRNTSYCVFFFKWTINCEKFLPVIEKIPYLPINKYGLNESISLYLIIKETNNPVKSCLIVHTYFSKIYRRV